MVTQVSSRELAGKKLQGYEKRDITYEVLVADLAKLLVANIHAKEPIARGCQKGMCARFRSIQITLRSESYRGMLTCTDARD